MSTCNCHGGPNCCKLKTNPYGVRPIELNIQQVGMERLQAQINMLNWQITEMQKAFETFKTDTYKMIINALCKNEN